MFKEHEQIVLTDTVRGDESETLKLGTSGTVVHVHPGARGYVVEFPSLEGSTPSIATVLPFQARLQKSAMSPQSFAVRIRRGQHIRRIPSKRHKQTRLYSLRRSRIPIFNQGARSR